MAAEPEDIPDEEPFSPSIFLNLSPTPPPHDDHQDPAASASSSTYHQYPSHQASQTSAEILSVANTISGGVGTSGFTLSPCFSDTTATVLDGVTCWPYDPVELSQKLLSSTTTTTPYPNNNGRDDGGLTMGYASTSVGFWQNGGKLKTATTAPASAGDDVGEHDALFSGGGAGETSRVTMDMLNQAFLKGMEEANKFLPVGTASTNQPRNDVERWRVVTTVTTPTPKLKQIQNPREVDVWSLQIAAFTVPLFLFI